MSYNSSGNRLQRETPAVFNLLLINGIVFLAQQTLSDINITENGALHYYKSTLFKPYQIVTNIFLHGGISHVLFNMVTLFFFGRILEKFWGSKKFLIFYLSCGIASSILVQFTIPFSCKQLANSIPMEELKGVDISNIVEYYKEHYSALGASGAIMGVLTAFAYLFPNTLLPFDAFIPIPIKAKYAILIYVVADLFGGIYKIKGDNVGHFAHLGGALVGFLLVLYWNKTNRKTFY